MLTSYSPLDFLEALARERQRDRSIAPDRAGVRRRIARWALAIDRWRRGRHPRAIAEPA
jgi:hypothetical protein